MGINGANTYLEAFCNFTVGELFTNQFQYLQFPFRQRQILRLVTLFPVVILISDEFISRFITDVVFVVANFFEGEFQLLHTGTF